MAQHLISPVPEQAQSWARISFLLKGRRPFLKGHQQQKITASAQLF